MFRKITITSIALSLVSATFATSLHAQSKNATLLGTFPSTSGGANDVWGFEDPTTGKPYCMFLTTGGTYILDVSNPATPVNRGYFAASLSGWRTSTWRDAKYWKGYGYVVTESGGGIQILDLRNPDSPTYVTTYKPTNVSWNNTHNIALDFQTGYVYCCGTGGGMHIIDVDSTPGTPKYITTWSSPYIHDLDIRDGYAHVAYIYSNQYAILDVSKLPTITQVGIATAPGSQYCHNNWATDDGLYSVTTNEASAGPIGIWDCSNKAAPKLISSYKANPTTAPTAIPHNAYILDYVIHASYYTEGYRCVDMSDPTKPVEVGYYDTYPGASGGYNGNWGCYPFARSGIQYISDRSTGLYLIKPLASAKRYGNGTKGSNGKVPHVHLKGAGYLGNGNFGIGVRDSKASSAAVYLIGGKPANVNAGGLEILVELVNPPALVLTAPTDATGKSYVGLPVPNDLTLNGAQINLQALCVDAGSSALDLSGSEGLEFTLFQN